MRNIYAFFVTALAVVSLVGNYLLFNRYSSQRPLVTVNNQIIRRKDLDDRMDYLYAKQTIQQMIYSDLVMQAATAAHLVPSDQDVNTALAEIQRAQPSLLIGPERIDPQLQLFRQDLKTKLALRNLQIQGIAVTTDQARAYYEQHQLEFALPQQAKTIFVVAADALSAEVAHRLLANNVAPAVIAETHGLHVLGVNAQFSGSLPPSISGAILQMRPGQIRTFSMQGQYVVVRVQAMSVQQIPPFDQIESDVVLHAQLARAPTSQQVLDRLREHAHIVANSGMFAADIPPSPSEQASSASQAPS